MAVGNKSMKQNARCCFPLATQKTDKCDEHLLRRLKTALIHPRRYKMNYTLSCRGSQRGPPEPKTDSETLQNQSQELLRDRKIQIHYIITAHHAWISCRIGSLPVFNRCMVQNARLCFPLAYRKTNKSNENLLCRLKNCFDWRTKASNGLHLVPPKQAALPAGPQTDSEILQNQ